VAIHTRCPFCWVLFLSSRRFYGTLFFFWNLDRIQSGMLNRHLWFCQMFQHRNHHTTFVSKKIEHSQLGTACMLACLIRPCSCPVNKGNKSFRRCPCFLQIGRPNNRCTKYFLPRQNGLPHMKCRPWILQLPILYPQHTSYNFYSKWHLRVGSSFPPRICCNRSHSIRLWPKSTGPTGMVCTKHPKIEAFDRRMCQHHTQCTTNCHHLNSNPPCNLSNCFSPACSLFLTHKIHMLCRWT
jgi:hypothetical protein